MHTLSQQGFCQPPEGDDNDEGGEGEADTGGVGVGDGSGIDDVSKEIEDESQIEGLQGDDIENKEREGQHDNEDGIEMDDDFEGALGDIPDAGSENDAESDADNEAELDETLGHLDEFDTSTVDEKMWGDEKGPEDSRDSEDQTNQDHSKKQGDASEVVGKEGKQSKEKEKQSEESEEFDLEGKDERSAEENEGNESNDPNVSGAPIDDQIPEANTLDLPDDIELGGDDVDMNDGSVVDDDTGMEKEDDGMGEENQADDTVDDDQVPDDAFENRENTSEVNNIDEIEEGEHADDEASREEIVAPPDISEGAAMADSTEPSHNDHRDNISNGELETSAASRQGPASISSDHEKIADDTKSGLFSI